jgi:uncharacterized membrane protein
MLKLKHYLITLPLVALDAAWLSITVPHFYQPRMSFLWQEANLVPVILFYPLFALGLTVFVTAPGMRGETSLGQTVLRGALFACACATGAGGLVAYAAYDLTNQATLRGWPWLVSAVDMAWGAALCALTACISMWVGRKI